LRRQVSRINGLREELHYYGSQEGWAPRYSAGDRELFAAHILPGRIEVSVGLDDALRRRLLTFPKLAQEMKAALENASAGQTELRIELPTAGRIRSFTQLVLAKNRFSAVPY